MKDTLRRAAEFKFIGKSLFFPDKGISVFGDLHIGYEEYLNEQGILIPRRQFKELIFELKDLFVQVEKRNGKKRLEKIIILGDLKHEFGRISEQEWKEVNKILDFLKKKSKEVILIKGNHDAILETLTKRRELKILDFYIEKGICFLHGHKLFPECLDKKVKMMVIGHRHPAILISDKYKKEKYKCFLVGKWKGKKIIILPSFFSFVEGSDVANSYMENNLFIPEKNLERFEVCVPVSGEEVYCFGKSKNSSAFTHT